MRKEEDKELKKVIKETFREHKSVYGQKRLYKILRKKGISIGKEKLAKIMKEENLVSKYVIRRKLKDCGSKCNDDKTDDKIRRKFNNKKPLEVVVSDLTYVNIEKSWHYICLLIELSHREIIGYSAGKYKDAELVKAAWMSVKKDIREICVFHTDRGSEFKNEEIDKILEAGNIERSLSRAGKPIDNAVCESMYDIVKTEFIFGENFLNLEDLQEKLGDWVWWYNNERIHSSLGYKTPIESSQSDDIGVTDEKIVNKKYQKFHEKINVHKQKVSVANLHEVF